MGNVRDKTLKNVPRQCGQYTGSWPGKSGRAKSASTAIVGSPKSPAPLGVIVGLVPATHPVATFIFKSLIAIKGRNAIIFSPSRRAHQVSQEVGAAHPAGARRRWRAR